MKQLDSLQRRKARALANRLSRMPWFGGPLTPVIYLSRAECRTICALLNVVIPSAWNRYANLLREAAVRAGPDFKPSIPARLVKDLRRALLTLSKPKKPKKAPIKRGRLEGLATLRASPRKPPIRVNASRKRA